MNCLLSIYMCISGSSLPLTPLEEGTPTTNSISTQCLESSWRLTHRIHNLLPATCDPCLFQPGWRWKLGTTTVSFRSLSPLCLSWNYPFLYSQCDVRFLTWDLRVLSRQICWNLEAGSSGCNLNSTHCLLCSLFSILEDRRECWALISSDVFFAASKLESIWLTREILLFLVCDREWQKLKNLSCHICEELCRELTRSCRHIFATNSLSIFHLFCGQDILALVNSSWTYFLLFSINTVWNRFQLIFETESFRLFCLPNCFLVNFCLYYFRWL